MRIFLAAQSENRLFVIQLVIFTAYKAIFNFNNILLRYKLNKRLGFLDFIRLLKLFIHDVCCQYINDWFLYWRFFFWEEVWLKLFLMWLWLKVTILVYLWLYYLSLCLNIANILIFLAKCGQLLRLILLEVIQILLLSCISLKIKHIPLRLSHLF